MTTIFCIWLIFSLTFIRTEIMSRRRTTQGRLEPTPPPNSTTIDILIAQHVANALAIYKASMTNTSGQSEGGGRSGIHGENSGGPRVCTYKDFLNYISRSFYGSE